MAIARDPMVMRTMKKQPRKKAIVTSTTTTMIPKRRNRMDGVMRTKREEEKKSAMANEMRDDHDGDDDVVVHSRPKQKQQKQQPHRRRHASASTKRKGGNLFFVHDTWTRDYDPNAHRTYHNAVTNGTRTRMPHTVAAADAAATVLASDARIDIVSSDDGTRTWEVDAPVSFSYRVVEAPGLLDPKNDALLFGHLSGRKRAAAAGAQRRHRRLVVIDEKVDALYGERVRAYMDARDVDYEVLTLPMVEEEKSFELMLRVCTKMKTFDLDRRNEPIIAIGGGVCLDVVGLAATLFRRKTPYIRVPTTTLSYVDASVGAKTGVNFMGSKNRLGAYVPPIAALLDPAFIVTEERRAIASGVAEMAKMAIVKSPELFALLETAATRLINDKFQPRAADDKVPALVLRLSIETMLEELAPNLNEKSLDRLVDFGHTIGQELEMHALGTSNELTHGESVAVDMAYSTVLAAVRGHISICERDRILEMLRRCSVPLYSPVVDRDFIDHAMSERVKQSMGQRLPLPTGIGKARLFSDVTNEELYEAFDVWTSLVAPATPADADAAAATTAGADNAVVIDIDTPRDADAAPAFAATAAAIAEEDDDENAAPGAALGGPQFALG